MRVLVTVVPGLGHFHPMVPLCRALVAAGHEVRVAVPPRFAPIVERSGLVPAHVRPDWLEEDADSSYPGFTAGGVPAQMALFTDLPRQGLVEDLVQLGRTWEPDLVMHDHTEFGGWIAAELLQIPNVPFAMTARVMDPAMLAMVAAEGVHSLLSHFDLPPDPELVRPARWLYLDSIPPSLAGALLPPGPTVRPVRYSTDDRTTGEAPDWLEELGTPLVYVTLGTVFNRTDGLLQKLIAAAAALDVDVVATTGRNVDPASLGALPPRVRVERYIPQVELLSRCDAVVCHGGFNTVFGAVGRGCPVVVVPISADQTLNAHLTELAGFGRSCTTDEREGLFPIARPEDLTIEQVSSALRDVLTDRTYRDAAARVADEMRTQPPVEDAVRLLEDLVAAT